MPPVHLPTIALETKVRLGFAVVTTLYAALTGRLHVALGWILLVVVLDLVATGVGALDVELPIPRTLIAWILVAACALGAGLAFNIVGPSAAPLAFIPAYHAGLLHGRLGFLVATLLCAVSSLVAVTLSGGAFVAGIGFNAFLLWTAATLILGILGAWSLRMRTVGPSESAESREARVLLQRLHELASEHGTELDAPAAASLLLERLAEAVTFDRGVVLGREPRTALQPLAIIGARRVAPHMLPDEALSDRIFAHGPYLVQWQDEVGVRSVLLCPLGRPGQPMLGLVTLDRAVENPFTEAELAVASSLTEVAAPDLEVALLFSSLRTIAAVEERQRLAGEMHDGIAQDLAALGFQIDAARSLARREAPAIATTLDGVRSALGDVITGLRSRIADLTMTQRPERSLGAVLSSAVQAFGAQSGIATTITVREGATRLPAHVEAALFRIVMDVLNHARSSGATSASVTADLHPREGSIVVEHDGPSPPPMPRLERHLRGVSTVRLDATQSGSHGSMVRAYLCDSDSPPQHAATPHLPLMTKD